MAYVAWSVSFGEQPSAAKWNILGTNDAYFDGLIGSGTAWTAWTPTWTNLTVGNATVAAYYQKFGKTVNAKLLYSHGSTSSVSAGGVGFSLPVTSTSTAYLAYVTPIGVGSIYDPGSFMYYGLVFWGSTTTARLRISDVSATYGKVTDFDTTTPFTMSPGDNISASFTYEAA